MFCGRLCFLPIIIPCFSANLVFFLFSLSPYGNAHSHVYNHLLGAGESQILLAWNFLLKFSHLLSQGGPNDLTSSHVSTPLQLNSTGPILSSSSLLAPCVSSRLTVSPRQQNMGAALTLPSLLIPHRKYISKPYQFVTV